MAINSREKGKKGERTLAHILRDNGYDARRGAQYCGANGDADVVGLDGVHIECKWKERLNVRDAMEQSKRDAREGEIPIVAHKKNYCEWLVTMRLEDFIAMYREWHNES